MIVLGLDPSLTNFGWAVYDSSIEKCILRGRISTSPKEFDAEVDRFIYIRNEVSKLIEEVNPDYMGCEQSVFGSSQSPAMYALFITTMEAIRYAQKDLVIWSPTQLKALARETITRPPKWKMEKVDMIEASCAVNGIQEKWNDNEADAFLISFFSMRWWKYWLKEPMTLSSQEYHAFAEYKVHKKGKKANKVAYKGIEHAPEEKFFMWSRSDKEKIGGKKQKESKSKSRETGKSRRSTKKSIQ